MLPLRFVDISLASTGNTRLKRSDHLNFVISSWGRIGVWSNGRWTSFGVMADSLGPTLSHAMARNCSNMFQYRMLKQPMLIPREIRSDLLQHAVGNRITKFKAGILPYALQNWMEIGSPICFLYQRSLVPLFWVWLQLSHQWQSRWKGEQMQPIRVTASGVPRDLGITIWWLVPAPEGFRDARNGSLPENIDIMYKS